MTRRDETAVERVRVLFLIKVLAPGGAEQLLLSHLHLIDRTRFETHVAHVFDDGGDFPEEVRRSCDATIRLSRGNRAGSHGVWGLARLLLTSRYDIVHIHSPVLGSMARLLLRLRPRRRPRIVSTEHVVWSGYHPLTRAINRWTIRGDDWVFAVSVSVMESIDVPHRDRVQVLIHGVELGRFAPDPRIRSEVRSSLGVTSNTLLIGCIANFRDQKNHPLLIEILAELMRRRTDFACILAGSGPLEEATRELVLSRGLGDRVQMLGVRGDIPRLLGAIDVLMLTSLWEGLPVVVMEALASGRPVVASDVDGIHDVLHESNAAYLFEPVVASIPDVCEVLDDLQKDAVKRSEMGREALALADEFDASRATTEMCERYLSLVTRGDGR